MFKTILRVFKFSLILLFSLGVFLALDMYFDLNYPKVQRVTFETEKLPGNASLRILQITDLHNRKFGPGNQDLLKMIRKENADMIALTGDLVDVRTTDYEDVYHLLDEIVRINPNTYFVSGNHEKWNRNNEKLIEEFAARKVRILDNKNTTFSKRGVSINLCGVEYVYVKLKDGNQFNLSEARFNKIFVGLNKSRYTVLLSHSPKVIDKLDKLPVDLILSGHTHGGQVRIPFLGGIISPEGEIFPKIDKGTYHLEKDRILYIDSGLGTSLIPIRLFNRSQMSLITIQGKG